jgi:hypothetical protein
MQKRSELFTMTWKAVYSRTDLNAHGDRQSGENAQAAAYSGLTEVATVFAPVGLARKLPHAGLRAAMMKAP